MAINLVEYQKWNEHSKERENLITTLIDGDAKNMGMYERFPDYSPDHPRRAIKSEADLKAYRQVGRFFSAYHFVIGLTWHWD